MNLKSKRSIGFPAAAILFTGIALHSAPVLAKKELTLLMSGDWHATLQPHAAVYPGPEMDDPPRDARNTGRRGGKGS